MYLGHARGKTTRAQAGHCLRQRATADRQTAEQFADIGFQSPEYARFSLHQIPTAVDAQQQQPHLKQTNARFRSSSEEKSGVKLSVDTMFKQEQQVTGFNAGFQHDVHASNREPSRCRPNTKSKHVFILESQASFDQQRYRCSQKGRWAA